MPARLSYPPKLPELLAHVRFDPDGCWAWTGAIDGRGYGNVGRIHLGRRKNWIVHRLVYELTRGEIPAGHEVHHTCEERRCVNPAHLEAVTRLEHQGVGGRHPDHMLPAVRASVAARQRRAVSV